MTNARNISIWWWAR
ncbi:MULTISPECIES: trpE operon leader peptide TrpLE [Sinorhizobium/Ensifer group]|nr:MULTISPECIES: trpE operon leader peptide TrpLE [Sinorhizobium/Ensifer group]MBD9490154.1 trpE operon leader peptide TrpLE [Ensifer sp. ENS11]UBI77539.1 trpE operon leader peptide TrpLE [Ensifer canadensis]